jgi:hypothetical protein
VTTYSLHPGVIASDIWRRIPQPFRSIAMWRMIGVKDGARTTLYCATDEAIGGHTGRYYSDQAEAEPGALALDRALARRLWAASEAWVR